MSVRTIALCLLGAAACLAQQYEIGGAVGGAFAKNSTVSSPAGSATAGFNNGAGFSVLLGHSAYRSVGGEVRMTMLLQDLKLASGGVEPTFKAQSYALHYDLLFQVPSRKSKVRPFAAAGGGFKLYRGTGKEVAYQPLGSSFAYLTKTQQWEPMASVGGGVKVEIAPRVVLRAEFRDYITPFPNKVIAPAPGVKASGWVNNIVPLIGISFLF
jgi:hypothetical protein